MSYCCSVGGTSCTVRCGGNGQIHTEMSELSTGFQRGNLTSDLVAIGGQMYSLWD